MALTDYEKYIRTEELLCLQKQRGELSCDDELQFQVVHQAAELWMKLISSELARVVEHLNADRPHQAIALMGRISQIQRILITQLDLLDTMSPRDYMTVRTALGRGSGQESPGFKTLLRLPGELLWPALEDYLKRAETSLRMIYGDPESDFVNFKLCEGFVDYDQLLQTWRYRHLLVVYRIIGVGTPSLKGKPSELLAKGMRQRFFPALWAVRDELFSEWTKDMISAGKADAGYH